MNWLYNTFGTSIGKKWVMAVTGLSFCGFLVFHLLGNLTIYGGSALFTWYAEHLHSMGILIHAAEWVMLLLFLVHVLTGLTLAYENFRARPVRYAVKRSAGGRTLGSRSMAITGLVILGFVGVHLAGFHFIERAGRSTYEIVSTAFHRPEIVGFYILAMAVAAIHVSHGFWSAFQSMGMGTSNASNGSFFKKSALVLSLVLGIGFGCIPVYISFVS